MLNPDWLEPAARRSRNESWMLGHAFERYLQLERRTEDELAQELGCTREALQWLSLCRRPEGEAFAQQARTIAEHFGVDLLRLVHVLRRVQVMNALTQTRDEATLLLAARDRAKDKGTSE